MMQVRRFDSIQEFCYYVQDYLLQHEAEHNLMLGILHTLLQHPDRYPDSSYLAVCDSHNSEEVSKTDNKILAVAIRTPPYKLVLSQAVDLHALKLIAQDLQNEGDRYRE